MNTKNISALVNTVINKKSNLPILTCVRLTENDIIITNLETTVFIPYHSGINACVEAEKFLKALNMMQTPSFNVTETIKGKEKIITVQLSVGERIISLTGEDPDNFPSSILERQNAPEFTKVGTINPTELQYFETALKFVSKDDLRPAMTGIFVSKEVVATDAHCLYHKKLSDMKEEFIIRPTAVKSLLIAEGPWQVQCGIQYDISGKEIQNKWALFTNEEGIRVLTSSINARFPDYPAVFPTNEPIAQLEIMPTPLKKELANAISFANKATKQGIFSLNGNVKLSSEDEDMGYSYQNPLQTISHEGELIIAFNISFMDKIIDSIPKTELITFQFWGPTKCMLINKDYLIMPLMLNQ